MATGKFVSYLRVSTDRQGRSGLGLEAQRAAVAGFLNGGAWELVGEFVEVESGKLSERPELARALAACKRLKATLVVAKLDRLSRDAHFLLGLAKAGVEFVAADMPHANKLTVGIMALVAEEEARAISARTKAALAAAKARGVQLGGPRLAEARELGVKAVRIGANNRAARVLPLIRAIQASGVVTLRDIAAELNTRGVKTARGSDWHPSTVRDVLRRA